MPLARIPDAACLLQLETSCPCEREFLQPLAGPADFVSGRWGCETWEQLGATKQLAGMRTLAALPNTHVDLAEGTSA